MWGPAAGYFANRSPDKFNLVPVSPTSDGTLPLTFSIAMGVARTNRELQARLDQFIQANQSSIQKLLESYGVPQLPIAEPVSQAAR
jgi:mxaJ protein